MTGAFSAGIREPRQKPCYHLHNRRFSSLAPDWCKQPTGTLALHPYVSPLYLMWVYKYGLFDPPAIRAEAKSAARSLLQSRFCAKPTHSDSRVQAIVNELLAP